ncbi:hypothetical protein NQ317_016683 [Molorchus minor]|uniref:Uncharacterized protein n=1 Tax=Molorchus minor TaxID=1323400 RepID=A0ABQ9JA60_9CUCU|nr:hypothetical protein NQ317_016683 [Molorchus minor]
MAVPFNIPEDQYEVEVIINQLQTLLTKLQAAVRRSRGANQQTPSSYQVAATSRVRSGASNRLRTHDEEAQQSSSTNFPELLNNLAWLAAASQGRHCFWTSSESSCCEETKISITATVNHGTVQDWNQDESSDEGGSTPGEGLLSKLLPSRVSAPLWTAMICFVGWHLFRAR